MDNVSEIYSLYSHPMTRGTTADYSEYLPTPLDGPEVPKNPKSAFLGQRSMSDNNGNLVRVDSSSSHTTRSHYEDGILDAFPNPPEFRSPQDSGPEPYEEYFFIPVPKDRSGSNDLQRRRSTKELIKRFESISAGNSPRDQQVHNTRTNLCAPKKTSPLRQSFRSLLSVFKKGKRFGKEKLEPYTAPIVPNESEPLFPQDQTLSNLPSGEHELDPFTINNDGLGSRICTSPTYSLHKGIQITEVVSLRGCTDVKSLTCDEIDAQHRALLPAMQNSRNPKVFELVFDAKDNQRFAAPTVKDRATWVSAIWDTLLTNHDKQLLERTKAEIRESLRIDTATGSSQPTLLTSPVPDLVSRQVPTPETLLTEPHESPYHDIPRLLETPAGPSSSSKQQFKEEVPNQNSPIGARKGDLETASSVADLSLLGSFSRSLRARSHSPSIVNLGRRSVVRKRLAEMQNHLMSDIPTSRDPHQSPSHTVATLPARDRPASNSEIVSEQLDSGSRFNASGLSVATERQRSPVSSQVSSIEGLGSRLTSPVSAVSNPSTPTPRPKSAFRLRDEMRTHASTDQHYHSPSERSLPVPVMRRRSSAATSSVEPSADDTVEALLDVMDVHAERQLIRTAELHVRLGAVQTEVQDVAANVRVAISGREQDSHQLAEINTTVGELRSALAHLATKTGDAEERKQHSHSIMATPIDEGLRTNQAQIFQALVEIQAMLRGDTISTAIDNKDNTTAERRSVFVRTHHDIGQEHADLSDIQHKLDKLLELSTPKLNAVSSNIPRGQRVHELGDPSPRKDTGHEKQAAKSTPSQPLGSIIHSPDVSVGDTQIKNDVDVLLGGEGKCTQLREQQAESVRYLNELNVWLEAFVNGGTAQMAAIADDVKKLCKTLGDFDESQNGPEGDTGFGGQTGTLTLLQSVRKLVADSHRRDHDAAHLLGTMNGLAAALNEDMRMNAEMRNAYTTESVLGVIERQRQDQERMLRTLANELSDDIRGERLRFVEAMKEATAINVQIHVEEFKKELTREVLISTQEVCRLQRERQLLEQQIADLFAFYSKQKQTATVSG
ncbi:hypothetical protein B0F90DRAFT_1699893 [Multifurca ochricompacta]|uniref:PH domain-containing protein n=1 Tax=Multifurca ochricompacta TaxID=376703 RepID=A0AAD4QR07_9AGAM|nr:hypothetical protein B0F90DRAFT_1699893 [Multifurca ochricompacta]